MTFLPLNSIAVPVANVQSGCCVPRLVNTPTTKGADSGQERFLRRALLLPSYQTFYQVAESGRAERVPPLTPLRTTAKKGL